MGNTLPVDGAVVVGFATPQWVGLVRCGVLPCSFAGWVEGVVVVKGVVVVEGVCWRRCACGQE